MTVRSVLTRCAAAMLGIAALLLLSTQAAQSRKTATAPAGPLNLAAVAPVMGCDALGSADIAAAVGAPPRLPAARGVADHPTGAYCAVKVTIDDYARFELHLPVKGWTQRLLFGGGPGAQTSDGMKLDQFATVSWEDLGRRQDEDVLANDYRGAVNAGYRGMHLQVLAAKALIGKFYGRGPRFSCFNACSNPGRESMIEVERFPQDFDGTGAGCPPINTTVNNGLFAAWNVMTNTGPDGQAIITADKLPILHKAVLDQCDAADGVKDGIVSDPYGCHPDLSAVACAPGQDAATCLAPAQVHAASELYRGAHDSAGNKLLPGGVLPGSELAWTSTIVPGGRFGGPEETRVSTAKAIRSHYSLPALPVTWTLKDLTFNHATFDATTKLSYLHDGTNPDLSGYARAGHKLILWMALGDTNVMPHQAVLYYRALQRQMGTKTVDGFVRFYVLPGVYHCGGGDGPVIANVLAPLMAWVERGIAPDALQGVHRAGGQPGMPFGPGKPGQAPAKPDLTRPIYPFPYLARYTGHGDLHDAANYVKGPARTEPADLGNWPGARFYKAGYMRWCTATATSIDCKTTR